jgi:hypothetical protein
MAKIKQSSASQTQSYTWNKQTYSQKHNRTICIQCVHCHPSTFLSWPIKRVGLYITPFLFTPPGVNVILHQSQSRVSIHQKANKASTKSQCCLILAVPEYRQWLGQTLPCDSICCSTLAVIQRLHPPCNEVIHFALMHRGCPV